MIIDTHSHLGDVLYGKNITFRQNVVSRDHHDYLKRLEENDNIPYPEFLAAPEDVLMESILNEEQARNGIATLQNMQTALDKNEVDRVWVLPILPTISFEEVLAASKLEPRIVPFTGIDFRLGAAAVDKALADAEKGAGGLKVHPILQRRPMDDEVILRTLEAWESVGKPVVFHTYRYDYYHPEQSHLYNIEFGSNPKFVELAGRFPKLTMIAAHAGGPFDFAEILEGKDLPNLYVDTSFQTGEVIEMFLRDFGPERVMFGSDWPWGCMETPIRLLKQIAGDDASLADLLFCENALRLQGEE